MNPNINYTLVGAFVLCLVAGLIGLTSWMTLDSDADARLPYYTYFYDSVSGLSERAQVKYRGVPIGYVESIALVSDPEEKVRLKLMLDADAPIRTDTYATLQYQGVTGLLTVELKGGEERGDPLPTSKKFPAEIPSQASRLVKFTDSLEDLSSQLNQLLQSFNRVSNQLAELTDDQMRSELIGLMQTSRELMTTSNERLEQLDPEIYARLAEELTRLASGLSAQVQTLPQMKEEISGELSALNTSLQSLIADTRSGSRQLGPALRKLELLLEQLRLEEDTWLRSNQIQPLGPGED
ncbi:MlaD family protein [Marinospirillum perlucidum]|uniref:MlaD family protein n=1 Tax=Marinospirillum perlucidum TaxID=1982602 RepID=UPI000DF207C0|nr:MlaD family protein [Marinospirillum perlucidum]